MNPGQGDNPNMGRADPPEAREVKAAFAERLSKLREAHALAKKTAAHELKIGYHRYVKYETGEREPPLWLLIRLAEYYGVSIDFLVAGRRPHQPHLTVVSNSHHQTE